MPEIFKEAEDTGVFLCEIENEEADLKKALADLVAKMIDDFNNGTEGADWDEEFRSGTVASLDELLGDLRADLDGMR